MRTPYIVQDKVDEKIEQHGTLRCCWNMAMIVSTWHSRLGLPELYTNLIPRR